MKLYQKIAHAIAARKTCIERGNHEWQYRHEETIKKLTDMLPHGSGIDGKNEIDLNKSTGEKIVIHTSFHHMDNNGYYDGWTEHAITVRASLLYGIDMHISGRDRNEIKDYLHEVFLEALAREVTE